MAINITKTEDRRVMMAYIAKDDNGNDVVSFNAAIGTGNYEAGTLNKTIVNKTSYFADLAKYKAIEVEFEKAYEDEAVIVLGGTK